MATPKYKIDARKWPGVYGYQTPQKIVDLHKAPTRFDYHRLQVQSGISQVEEEVFGGSIWLDHGQRSTTLSRLKS